MSTSKPVFSGHALARMAVRRVTEEEIEDVLAKGEIIERYPDDTPYPSILMLGFPGGRPLHVVAAEVVETGETFVITVYEPDPDLWDRERKRRMTP